VDPIDGTLSLRHRIPLYGVLLALELDETPVVGVIGLPELGRVYAAARGLGARCEGAVLRTGDVESDEMVATLGPEAWPAPPLEELARRIAQPRHLHPMLRDQRVIAGIGRSWVDEVLWEAALSPFRQGSELDDEEVERLHGAMHVLGDAIDHYEEVIGNVVPDKMPMPLQVHRREGAPCPRCGATLAAVHFAEHVTTYCPEEQTGGRVLKDRRLSRLLK